MVVSHHSEVLDLCAFFQSVITKEKENKSEPLIMLQLRQRKKQRERESVSYEYFLPENFVKEITLIRFYFLTLIDVLPLPVYTFV